MKKMILVLMLLMPLTLFAQSVDIKGLTKEQVAELNAQAAKMKSPEVQVQGISAAVRNETAAWANLGANIGTAMVSAARELGIAANEFSQTGLGRIVTVVIVYKIVGKDILGVAVGSMILLIGFALGSWICITHRFGEYTYAYQPAFWGLYQRRVVTNHKIDGDAIWAKFWLAVITFLISLIVGLKCIF